MISDQRTEGRWEDEEEMGWESRMDVGRGRIYLRKKGSRSWRTENLEARRLAQISVPKDTGGGLDGEAEL